MRSSTSRRTSMQEPDTQSGSLATSPPPCSSSSVRGRSRCSISACPHAVATPGKRLRLATSAAVGVHDARGHEPDVRLAFEHADEHVEVGGAEHRVRVEQEDVGRLTAGDAEVAAVGEAAVARRADRVDGEVGDRGERVVAGGVVDHDHTGRPAPPRADSRYRAACARCGS